MLLLSVVSLVVISKVEAQDPPKVPRAKYTAVSLSVPSVPGGSF